MTRSGSGARRLSINCPTSNLMAQCRALLLATSRAGLRLCARGLRPLMAKGITLLRTANLACLGRSACRRIPLMKADDMRGKEDKNNQDSAKRTKETDQGFPVAKRPFICPKGSPCRRRSALSIDENRVARTARTACLRPIIVRFIRRLARSRWRHGRHFRLGNCLCISLRVAACRNGRINLLILLNGILVFVPRERPIFVCHVSSLPRSMTRKRIIFSPAFMH